MQDNTTETMRRPVGEFVSYVRDTYAQPQLMQNSMGAWTKPTAKTDAELRESIVKAAVREIVPPLLAQQHPDLAAQVTALKDDDIEAYEDAVHNAAEAVGVIADGEYQNTYTMQQEGVRIAYLTLATVLEDEASRLEGCAWMLEFVGNADRNPIANRIIDDALTD